MGTSAIAILLALLPTAALAAAQSPPLSQTDPAAVIAKPSDDSQPVSRPPAAENLQSLDETPRFVLVHVIFDGVRAVPLARLEPAWRGFQGRSVSLADLRAIASAAERIYSASGYPFVAVVLNPQKVVAGEVRFRVVEGEISNLTILGANPSARRQATAAFEPLVNRTPLAAGAVETAYERAKAVPGLTVAGALRRGGEPGGMDLLIQAERQAWSVYANLNDLYPDALGPWGALVGVDHNGGSRFGDETSAQVYESLDGGRQTVVRISHEQGLSASGTALTLTALGAWANPGREVAPLALATNVATGRIALSQPLFARLAQSLTATAAFEVDDQKTKVFSHIGLTDDRLRILSLAVDGEWRYGGGGRLALSAEVRQGLPGLGGSRPGDPSLSRQGADPGATVGAITLQGQSPGFHKLRLALRVDGQIASAALTAPQQCQVGNLSIGRGYQPGANFGDDALAASGELRLGPFEAMRRFTVEPFAFYDVVHVWTLTPGAHSDRVLSSVGGGIRAETRNHLHIDFFYAQPLAPPLGLGEPTPGGRLLVNVTVGLNQVYDALHRHLAWGGAR